MEKLLEKAKGGDAEATERIINKFAPFVLREATRFYIKGFDYQDLVQHGYLSIIKAINMYNDPLKSFNAYCITAIKLNFRALLKKEIKHFRENPNQNISKINDNNYKFTVEDECIAYEEVKKINDELNKLSKEEREIIEKFYIKHYTIDEVARDLHKTNNNVRYIKKRIIKKLQSVLERHI